MHLNIVGNAHQYTAVILDLIGELYSKPKVVIHCNLAPVDPVIYFHQELYSYELQEIKDKRALKSLDNLVFGVNGSKAKQIIWQLLQVEGNGMGNFLNLIHPSAHIAQSVKLSYGLVLEALSTISTQTEIGFGVNVKGKVNISHHCKIGDFVEINPGVTICSNVKIGSGTLIGAGSIIRNKVSIGQNSVIGMGSVVLSDIPDRVVAFGNPCKVIRNVEELS
jgi:sugar O-acyltransferase (sialic acid O-acetyltransferase NeuD family)